MQVIFINKDELQIFYSRDFHPEVVKHCKDFFIQGNYFYCIAEATKAYNTTVKEKSKSQKDGFKLTEINIQNGIKYLSSGIILAFRNPTAHESKIAWPVNKQDCLDILSSLSYLFRQLDTAVYVPAPQKN